MDVVDRGGPKGARSSRGPPRGHVRRREWEKDLVGMVPRCRISLGAGSISPRAITLLTHTVVDHQLRVDMRGAASAPSPTTIDKSMILRPLSTSIPRNAARADRWDY
ncbi:hypothetical protein B296_00034122 [Ensete ventricosum]|uniref:Uncharacterized protein n=1 Tax=Ensete ventricosum TaxID=4639 RepID=A0A427A287_ENSVE|nr:hypothetical protein B296_00034122 [Ensete ventricosum]